MPEQFHLQFSSFTQRLSGKVFTSCFKHIVYFFSGWPRLGFKVFSEISFLLGIGLEVIKFPFAHFILFFT